MARPQIEGEVSDMTGQKTIDWSCRPASLKASSGTRCRRGFASAPALVVTIALSTLGCRTDTDDVERWANTVQGPRKLVAVLVHDRYPLDLRVEAALALVKMKPRGGRRIGIQGTDDQPGLVTALSRMTPARRAAILSRLVPALETEIARPPAPARPGQPPVDASIPYKDAAFALLIHENGTLIAEDKLKQRLRVALANWASTNFAQRMDDSSQTFSVEQVLRELKADGVRKLPELLQPNGAKLDRLSDLIADLGDGSTRARASQKLVVVAQNTASEAWLQQKAPLLERLNKESKKKPTAQQFNDQLKQYQEEELLRVFASMRRVGGPPAVDFLLAFAQDKAQSEKKRAGALAALQGNLDKSSTAHAEGVLAIASAADTPDSVRDRALQRVGEFPRAMVVDRLYALFKDPTWQVRWVAAELVLKMSDTGQLPEFFDRIGSTSDGMSITEPLRYGQAISTMKGPQSPVEIVQSRLDSGPAGARLTALGYYYHAGTPADLPRLESVKNDKTKVPECSEQAKDCEWKCDIVVSGTRETKDIKTVGEFYEFCVKPALEQRQLQAAGKPAPN
jgi:hypothetical protein